MISNGIKAFVCSKGPRILIKVEGEPDGYFDQTVTDLPLFTNAPVISPDDLCKPINTSLLDMGGSGSRAEDIALAQSQGLDVDDDNEPAPENAPAEGVAIDTTSNLHGQTWGWGGTCHQKLHIIHMKVIESTTIPRVILKSCQSLTDLLLLFYCPPSATHNS